jgi:hypothetical protein
VGMSTSQLKSTAVTVVLICSFACQPRAGDLPAGNASSVLPPQVQKVKGLLQGKSRDEIRELLINNFGPVQRYGGRGIRIDIWEVARGELAFNPVVGPTFTPKGKHRIWLLTTHNILRTNLLGEYEMVTLPADASGSGRCWLGNLVIEPNLSYSYKDSGQFPEKSSQQTNNFFYIHPAGTVEVQYAPGVSDKTLLEALPGESVVAWLLFHSGNGKARQSFAITSIEPSRRLVFGASAPLSFGMDKSWVNFWE